MSGGIVPDGSLPELEEPPPTRSVMRVHHLDCGTLCPAARRLANGEGSLFERGHLVCHCLLIEAPDGLVLVEAGIGTHDAAHRLPGMFELIAGPPYDPIATARGRVRALGFAPEDVRHIVLTHLDLDHAGGIADPTDFARLQAG